jgi:hypothetical protein
LGPYFLVALILSSDLFICAKDLFVEAKPPGNGKDDYDKLSLPTGSGFPVLGAGLDSQDRNRQIRHTFGMQVVSIASRPQCEASETAKAPFVLRDAARNLGRVDHS